ncbi:hypothetical protein GQ42DRAFT_75066 [Ramicandelaber brevisporus]|nr:hypothetical protein GQ42DRAFT_75066 [Ramicandelaber brevisporus]
MHPPVRSQLTTSVCNCHSTRIDQHTYIDAHVHTYIDAHARTHINRTPAVYHQSPVINQSARTQPKARSAAPAPISQAYLNLNKTKMDVLLCLMCLKYD